MPTPSWTKEERWKALIEGTDCPLCERARGADVVADLEASVVTADETVAVKGYCCIILKEHRTELHQLGDEAGMAFMRDVKRVSAAVQSITGAIKLNYEVHGNVVPHVHMHVIPRYPRDEIEMEDKPFAQNKERVYADGEFAAYTRKLSNALKVLVIFALQACSGEPRPAAEPAIGADTMVAEMAEPNEGPKACDLLTRVDIKTATGREVGAGIVTNDYMGVSQCRFDQADSTQVVMVSLHQQGDIENYRKVPGAADVAGLADAAVWNPQTMQIAFRRDSAVVSVSLLFEGAEQRMARELAEIALRQLGGR